MMFNQNPYNNPFAAPRFDPPMSQPSYTNQYQPQSNLNNIIWVQGESGAKAFQLPANSNIILMDNDEAKFYIKSTDAVGMTTMRTFEFIETTNDKPNTPANPKEEYVTRKEFEELKGMIEYAKSALLSNAATPTELPIPTNSQQTQRSGGNHKGN